MSWFDELEICFCTPKHQQIHKLSATSADSQLTLARSSGSFCNAAPVEFFSLIWMSLRYCVEVATEVSWGKTRPSQLCFVDVLLQQHNPVLNHTPWYYTAARSVWKNKSFMKAGIWQNDELNSGHFFHMLFTCCHIFQKSKKKSKSNSNIDPLLM